ncbi:MAG: hypothetical protein ACTHQQ_03935, partial [Solirubrobacteraceae bacterium]
IVRAPMTTSCSIVAVWFAASVTVRVTYFVAATWKVKSSVCPVPSGQVPPDGGSSAQGYVHGVAWHVDALASKWTAWPVTGLAGEELNAAVGGAGAALVAV